MVGAAALDGACLHLSELVSTLSAEVLPCEGLVRRGGAAACWSGLLVAGLNRLVNTGAYTTSEATMWLAPTIAVNRTGCCSLSHSTSTSNEEACRVGRATQDVDNASQGPDASQTRKTSSVFTIRASDVPGFRAVSCHSQHSCFARSLNPLRVKFWKLCVGPDVARWDAAVLVKSLMLGIAKPPRSFSVRRAVQGAAARLWVHNRWSVRPCAVPCR
jgi:hypothetical protein